MDRFEYEQHTLEPEEAADTLKEKGAEGWELVSVVGQMLQAQTANRSVFNLRYALYVFKRRIVVPAGESPS